MLYVGLDSHAARSSMCILNESGQVVNRREIKGSGAAVVQELKTLAEPFSLCYEASCGYGHLYDRIRPLAAHVVVAHPGKLRLIYRSKRKNDRLDAAKLAKLLLLDMVPQVHVPRLDVRDWRGLILWRQRLVDKLVICKNQIRAALREAGIESPGKKSMWTRRSFIWLREQDLGATGGLKVEMALDELIALDQRIKRVNKELAKIADTHPGVALLRTIPGVGAHTAETFCAWVDDPARFQRVRQIGAYFGLVPCQDSSADKNRLGHITREGPAVMRKLLTEATWVAVSRDPHFKAFFQRVMGNKPDRKKIALVATAHHLCRVMLAMLQSGEPYRRPVVVDGGSGRGEGHPIRPQAVPSAPPTPTPPPSRLPLFPGGVT